MSNKVQIRATTVRVPYPGMTPLVKSGKTVARAPRRYLELGDTIEVTMHEREGYWARRLVRGEVERVKEKPKKEKKESGK